MKTWRAKEPPATSRAHMSPEYDPLNPRKIFDIRGRRSIDDPTHHPTSRQPAHTKALSQIKPALPVVTLLRQPQYLPVK